MRRRKPWGAPSPVFSMPAVHMRGAPGTYKDSGDLPSEIARREIPKEHFGYCAVEGRYVRQRGKPVVGACAHCEAAMDSQGKALNDAGVPNGNLPRGVTRVRA